MDMNVVCPDCGKKHTVLSGGVGQNILCPCGARIKPSPPRRHANAAPAAAQPIASVRKPAPHAPPPNKPRPTIREILDRHPILLISFWVMIGTIAIGALATVGSIWRSGDDKISYLIKTGLATGTLFLAALLTMGIGTVYVGDGRTGLLNRHLLYTVCFTLLIVSVVLGTFFAFVIIWGDAGKVSFHGLLSVGVIALASVLTTMAGAVYLGKGSDNLLDKHFIHWINFAVVMLCIVGGMLFSIVAIWSEKPDIAYKGDLSAVVVFVTTMLISMIVRAFMTQDDEKA